MDLKFEPGSSSIIARNVGTRGEERKDREETQKYGGWGAGGKVRQSRKSSQKKTTPYDRPASGRHATAGGLPSVSAYSSSSLASRLVGSASRLIASSASYFFPSLFDRKTLALTNGNPASVQGTISDEQDEEEEMDPVMTQETDDGLLQSRDTTDSGQDLAIVTVGAASEKKELDLARVEDMLKQKTWSREQVNRLTNLLNARMVEHRPTTSRFAGAGAQSSDRALNAVETTPRGAKENTSIPITEAQRWREELKRARTDCTPIEVARAYMGERTSSQAGFARSLRGTTNQIDRVAELQPPPGLGLADDRYRSFPVVRSWSRSPATQLPNRSSLLDDDWMSVGPVRRTRQKIFQSPYARVLPAGDSALPRTHMSPPVQSSQTARKILDTLEMLSPSPKSRLLNDDPAIATDPPVSLTRESFNLQGRMSLHSADVSKFSILRDFSPSNGKLEFGSPSYQPTSTMRANKESKFEDKSLVTRLLSNNEANLFNVPSGVSPKGVSSATSLPGATLAYASLVPSSVTDVPTSESSTIVASYASLQPEREPFFSSSIKSMSGSQQHVGSVTVELPVTVPALSTSTTIPAVTALVTTSASCAWSTAATLKLSPANEQQLGKEGTSTEDQLKGLDDTVQGGAKKVSNEQGSPIFQFGSSSSLASFSFQTGTHDFAAGGQSKLPFSSLISSSKTSSSTQFDSSPISSAVSTAPVLFGSQSGTFPAFKPSTPGQLFSTSSIAKPTTIHSLTIEPSSGPFTFSPPPAPVSCTTPTFCFGSNSSVAQVSASCSVQISSEAQLLSSAQDPITGPVFSFTSPSGGPKLPGGSSEDEFKDTLQPPKFTFGTGASPPSAELSAGSAPLMTSFESGAGSTPLPSSFTFGGQTASGQLFGSGAGSTLSQSSFSFSGQMASATGLEPTASFTTGTTVSEKAGRKYLKAKRRK